MGLVGGRSDVELKACDASLVSVPVGKSLWCSS